MATIVARRFCGRNVPNVCRFFSSAFARPPILNCHSGYVYRISRYPLAKHLLPPSCTAIRTYAEEPDKACKKDDSSKKLSLLKRFKQMYRDYWYVLVPVHVITSAAWFGGFYYLAKSGIDIIPIMESWHVSEVIMKPLRESSMGYIAVSYALYKIATPLRYMVTLGGTTVSIKYLKEWGYIKPVPSTQQLKDMYLERRENIMETMRGRKDNLKYHTDQFKEKTDNLIEGLEKRIKIKIADSKEQLKDQKKDILSELQKPIDIKRKDH